MEQEIEQLIEKKVEWLADRGLTLSDVLLDEETGLEYVMMPPQLADEGEVESGKFKQVYLPEFNQE